MKYLIVHPNDRSTDFLKRIYSQISTPTLITGGITKSDLIDSIDTHDRCLFLGHGLHTGLLSMNKFKTRDLTILDGSMAPILKSQTNNLYIWCHAKSFVQKHDLHGIFSDMFISEINEALYYNFKNISKREIEESNYVFSEIVGSNIGRPINETYDVLIREYSLFSKGNTIARFNCQRLYLR